MSRQFRRPLLPSAILWMVLLAFLAWRIWSGAHRAEPIQDVAEGTHHVECVVDGDTLVIEAHQHVRLIGVDAPETVKPHHTVDPWGPEASAFSKQFLRGGVARLQFDRERVDRYGRLLAYVWVDNRMLNEELVRAGLARYEPQYHYSQAMKRRFRLAEQEARSARRGIWSTTPSLN